MSPFLIAVILSLFLYKIYKWSTYKPDGFPPGPPRIPLIGSYWALLLLNRGKLHKAALTLGKYYKTKVLGIWLGDYPTVVVNDYELIKETFQRTVFDAKPEGFTARLRDPHGGLYGK